MVCISEAIQTYVLAKDGNRPFILNSAFEEDATLQMNVCTDSIDFPELVSGREAIANTLVRDFNKTYENIYTLCIGSRPKIYAINFSCQWLVVMTEKLSGSLRIGCGSYDWVFTSCGARVQSLTITIDTMETISSDVVPEVLAWVAERTYPWCELPEIAKQIPGHPAVISIVRQLQENELTLLKSARK